MVPRLRTSTIIYIYMYTYTSSYNMKLKYVTECKRRNAAAAFTRRVYVLYYTWLLDLELGFTSYST